MRKILTAARFPARCLTRSAQGFLPLTRKKSASLVRERLTFGFGLIGNFVLHFPARSGRQAAPRQGIGRTRPWSFDYFWLLFSTFTCMGDFIASRTFTKEAPSNLP